MRKQLHLVSFDIPYPPNYGGVIDVYYKIKELHKLGIEVFLHCFEYSRKQNTELYKICKEVYYYPRNSYTKSLLSINTPFIVKSRGNKLLIENLTSLKAPILFDGLHTTFVRKVNDFKGQKCFVRAHNVEHEFYTGLAESETSFFKKNFYKLEAKKLERYENILSKMEGVFSISPKEHYYFSKKLGNKVHYIPAFHNVTSETKISNSEPFVLYHGNLIVSENVKAAKYLIDIYKNSKFQLVIASSFSNTDILKLCKQFKNIKFQELKSREDMLALLEKAHINALPTFQDTGFKLKLLITLYQGKFIIANRDMTNNTGLEELCVKANSKEEFLSATEELLNQNFTVKEREKRLKALEKFSPSESAKKMVEVIFNS